MVPVPSENTVAVCNPVTLLVFYNISSRLLTLLTVFDAPVQVSYIFYFTVTCKFINFNFQIFLLFAPELSTSFASYIVQIIYNALVGFWNHCILARFLDLKNVNIHHQTMVYASSICTDLDSL